MDIAIPAGLYSEDENNKLPAEPPSPPLPTPLNTQTSDGNKDQPDTNGTDDEELKELQKPIMAAQFREFCGNPEGAALRKQHLEHLVGNLIIANRTIEKREKTRQANENTLRDKVEELSRRTAEHAGKIDQLPSLERVVNENTAKMAKKRTTNH